MRNLGIFRLVIVIAAAFMIGLIPHETLRAATEPTSVITSYSKPNDAVYGSMVEISLGFEVPVDHQRSTLILRSTQGDRQIRPRLESPPNYLFGIVGRLPAGDYELIW